MVAREQDVAQSFGVRDISRILLLCLLVVLIFVLLAFVSFCWSPYFPNKQKNKHQTTNDEPKSTVWNTIRYRARNMFGNDGRVLRIICLVGTVVLLILVGVVIGTTVNKKSNTQLRHPKHNGYEAFNWDDLKPNVQTAAVRAAQTNKRNTTQTHHTINLPSEQTSIAAGCLSCCRNLYCVNVVCMCLSTVYVISKATHTHDFLFCFVVLISLDSTPLNIYFMILETLVVSSDRIGIYAEVMESGCRLGIL